ncbi:MAG: high-affinity nickel-transport family protein [Elusimicrobia bacterium]|nr:high-affinity nickel-transport family protein [Elusimicrobiota bacterium]
MTNLLSILALGFWLGMRHATDPDHVVAISTIVARNKKWGASWLLGAVWGLGHTVTIFAVGTAIIMFKVNIPPRVGLAMEFGVGLVLIALGAFNMAGGSLGTLGLQVHSHAHDHHDPGHGHLPSAGGGHSHSHAHLREVKLGWLRSLVRDAGLFQILRSGAVGLVHGLAGSAAVALLVLATIKEPPAAVMYLLVFGAGTLVGMLLMSALMEMSMLSLGRKWRKADKVMALGTGLLSAAFGAWVVYKIGWADGLFGPNPSWTPE